MVRGNSPYSYSRRSREKYQRRRHRHNVSRSVSIEKRLARDKRAISESIERSRERERRRRKAQAECIRRAGGFQKLADNEGKEPVRLFWDGFQWVAKTGSGTTLQSDPALMNCTRKMRRLYVGNLPTCRGLNEAIFQDLISLEMINKGICNDPSQPPVLCVWFAKDKGNYGFIEFASVEETNRALEALDGMNCLGVSLKISRPNDYASVVPGMPSNIMGSGDIINNGVANDQASNAPLPTSKVVRFCSMVKEEDFEENETWEEFLDDIKTGCSSHGIIVSAAIITPNMKGNCPYEIGDVFLEFESPVQAAACINGRSGRKYLGRSVVPVSIEDAVYSQLIKPLLSKNY